MKKIIALCYTVLLNLVYTSAHPGVNLVPFASDFTDGISDISHADDNCLFEN